VPAFLVSHLRLYQRHGVTSMLSSIPFWLLKAWQSGRMRLAICLTLELGSRLGDSEARVVLGIAFVTGTVLGNLQDDVFGVFAAG